MPRYVFTTVNGSGTEVDTRAVVLPTLDEARKYALRTIGGILFDETLMGRDDIAIAVHIDDEDGERVASVTAATRIAFSPR